MTKNSIAKTCRSSRKSFGPALLFPLLCAGALLAGCNKTDNKTTPAPNPTVKTIDTPVAKWAMTLRVVEDQRQDLTGSSDTIRAKTDSTYTRYIYEVISGRSLAPNGTAEQFLAGSFPYAWQLDTNNLPAGIHITSTPAGGTAKFDGKYPAYYSFSEHTEVKIAIDQSVASGTYDYVLRGSNAKTNDGYKLYLHGRIVIPAVSNDCVAERLGTYTGTASCAQNGSGSGSGTVTAVSGTPNRIQFSGSNGIGFYADLNCANHTLTIPSQSIGQGILLEGSGTFGTTTMTFTLHYSGALTDTCVYTVQK